MTALALLQPVMYIKTIYVFVNICVCCVCGLRCEAAA